jgi:hypothetical protein
MSGNLPVPFEGASFEEESGVAEEEM